MWFSWIGWFIMPLLTVFQPNCWWFHYGLFCDAMFVWSKIHWKKQRSSNFTNQQANSRLLIEIPNLLFTFSMDEIIPINKSNILEWFAHWTLKNKTHKFPIDSPKIRGFPIEKNKAAFHAHVPPSSSWPSSPRGLVKLDGNCCNRWGLQRKATRTMGWTHWWGQD